MICPGCEKEKPVHRLFLTLESEAPVAEGLLILTKEVNVCEECTRDLMRHHETHWRFTQCPEVKV